MSAPESYYIQGLMPQANSAYARTYLGVGATDVVTIGYIKNTIPLWQDVRIPLSSTRPGAAAPTASAFVGNTRAYRWDNAGPVQSLEWELQIPHGLNESATYGVRLHVHWTAGSITSPNVVEWNVEVVVAEINGTFPGATNTYSGTGLTTVAFQHVVTPLHTFTGLHDSSVIVGRIYRSIGGGDTYAGNDVFGLSLDAHYVVEQVGSIDEFGD